MTEELRARQEENAALCSRLQTELTEDKLQKRFKENVAYLKGVECGEVTSARHQAFHKSARSRQALYYKMITHPFSDEQLTWTLKELTKVWMRTRKDLESEDRIPPALTPTSQHKKLPSSPVPRRSLQAHQISLQSPQEQPKVPTYSTSSTGAKPVIHVQKHRYSILVTPDGQPVPRKKEEEQCREQERMEAKEAQKRSYSMSSSRHEKKSSSGVYGSSSSSTTRLPSSSDKLTSGHKSEPASVTRPHLVPAPPTAHARPVPTPAFSDRASSREKMDKGTLGQTKLQIKMAGGTPSMSPQKVPSSCLLILPLSPSSSILLGSSSCSIILLLPPPYSGSFLLLTMASSSSLLRLLPPPYSGSFLLLSPAPSSSLFLLLPTPH